MTIEGQVSRNSDTPESQQQRGLQASAVTSRTPQPDMGARRDQRELDTLPLRVSSLIAHLPPDPQRNQQDVHINEQNSVSNRILPNGGDERAITVK